MLRCRRGVYGSHASGRSNNGQTVELTAHNGQARLLRLMRATQLFLNLRNLFFECAYDRDGCHAIPQIRANCLSTVWYQHFGSTASAPSR
jgi:hypothetical protein